MPYQESSYRGDEEYRIDCTHDVCEGDDIRFHRTRFTGSPHKPQAVEFTQITGTVLSASYGEKPHHHAFTLRLADHTEMHIKGRNLYANGCWRKPWPDESQRKSEAP